MARLPQLWLKGLSPFRLDSDNELREINLAAYLPACKIETESKGIARVLIEITSPYAFVVCNRKLFAFSAILEQQREVDLPADAISLAANSAHCLILLRGGTLLKYDPMEDSVRPLDFFRSPVTHVSCGERVTVACTSDNGVYNVPTLTMDFPRHVRIKKVATGIEHCILLTTNGDVYCWGGGLRGQLGGGEIVTFAETPTLVDALAGLKIVDIAASGWHSAAVSSFGDLYTWGLNQRGQLGLTEDRSVVSLPRLVSGFADEITIKRVHCGTGHMVLVTDPGSSEDDLLIAGDDLDRQFRYDQPQATPNYGGFRPLARHPAVAGKSYEIGSGPTALYFLEINCPIPT